MPKIFDNIENQFSTGLSEHLAAANRVDYCVGYFNLRGWGMVCDGINSLSGAEVRENNIDSTISRPEIQKFAGALLGEGATNGVFITTASFSKSAVDYAKSVPNSKIILIDGLTLARFMIKHDLGVSTSNTIRIKKIDSDYFEEQ